MRNHLLTHFFLQFFSRLSRRTQVYFMPRLSLCYVNLTMLSVNQLVYYKYMRQTITPLFSANYLCRYSYHW